MTKFTLFPKKETHIDLRKVVQQEGDGTADTSEQTPPPIRRQQNTPAKRTPGRQRGN